MISLSGRVRWYVAFLLISAGACWAGTAQWEFGGDLSSSTGQAALTAVGYPGVGGAPGVTFENTTIGGSNAQVAHLTDGTALVVLHGFPSNGGGSYLNQYTIIMDAKFPVIDWISLYQTNESYDTGLGQFDLSLGNDGDWFIRPEGGVGISGIYGGTVVADTWHRLALVVDLVAGTYTSYIDGTQVQQLTGQSVDGRFALYTSDDPDPFDWFLLFADETDASEMGEVLVNSFQFQDRALSGAEIGALGGPTALGIGVEPPPPCSVPFLEENFDAVADDAALTTAGWTIAKTGPEEADWTTTNPGGRANPPTENGSPSTGKFIISDSDAASTSGGGDGTGQSYDITTPAFSTTGGTAVWLHASTSAQLNNSDDAVFDVDVSTDGGTTFTNVFRRVSPGTGRAAAPLPDTTNADGFFGRLSVDISSIAADKPSVRIRFRHFEPSDDWWIALDDIRVDCDAPLSGGEDVLFSESFAAGLGSMSVLSGAGNTGTETWHTTDKGNRYVAGAVSGRGVNRINHPSALKEFVIMDSDADPDPAEVEYLVTPVLDLSNYCDVFLHFQSETVVSGGATQAVVYSLDGGASVAGVAFKYNDTTGTTGPNALFDGGEEPFYAERVLSVAAVAGQPSVVFGFLYQSPGDQWWWALDNIKVTATECEVVGETCDNPVTVAVPSSTNGTTAGASPDNIGACGANNSPAVWFKVVGTGRDITAQLCGSPLDTRISLFEGACNALVCAGENDDSCGAGSRVHWTSVLGSEYRIRVFGSGDGDSGGFTLTVLDSPVPANDVCASAVSIDLAVSNPAVVAGTNRGATVDAGAPACGDIRAPGVWYSVAGTGGPMGASTCSAGNFDSRISVFSGNCGALVCVTENDDADGCGNATSVVSWDSVFGETYLILVHGFDALPGRYHVGDFSLTVSGQPRPCMKVTSCRANQTTKAVTLVWETVASGHTGLEIALNGQAVATVGPGETSFVHTPALTPGVLNTLEYSVSAVGIAFECSDSCRAVLSPGRVCLADDFEDYVDDVALELAGYFRVDEVPDPIGRPGEAGTWTVTNPGQRANPPTFDGKPSNGKFAISDSDAAGGDNGAPGSGNSNDLWSPSFSTVGKTSVWLHMDLSAQMNNNGVVVFDVDGSTDGGQTWANVYRTVAPSRVGAPPVADTTNADGFFGRLDVDISSTANKPDVRLRLRSFEPSDDWWIAVDNVIVDDVAPPAGGSESIFSEDFSSGLGAMTAVSLANPPNAGTETWTTTEKCAPPRSIVTAGGVFPIYDGRGVHRLAPPYAILESECDPDPAEDEYLLTPALDLTFYGAVYLHYRSEVCAVTSATQEVLLSLDGGATFDPAPLFSYNGGGLFDSGEEPFYAARILSVPQAAGASSVSFAFHYKSAGNQRFWAIDDVKVTATSICDALTVSISGATSATTGSTVHLTSSTNAAEPTYKWEVASGTATIVGSSTADSVDVTSVSDGASDVKLTVTDACGKQASATHTITFTPAGGGQVPGDCNQDGQLTLADAICVLNYLFLGADPAVLPCAGGDSSVANKALLDANGDNGAGTGRIDIGDAIFLLNRIALGGPPHVLGESCVRIADCPDNCIP